MTTIPPTWTDSTDDICPRPRHVRAPTPEEMQEAENNVPPRRAAKPYAKRKTGTGNGAMDLRPLWEGKYESEREYLLDMLRIYKTGKHLAQVLGRSPSAVQGRIRRLGIPVVKGWGGGLVE